MLFCLKKAFENLKEKKKTNRERRVSLSRHICPQPRAISMYHKFTCKCINLNAYNECVAIWLRYEQCEKRYKLVFYCINDIDL